MSAFLDYIAGIDIGKPPPDDPPPGVDYVGLLINAAEVVVRKGGRPTMAVMARTKPLKKATREQLFAALDVALAGDYMVEMPHHDVHNNTKAWMATGKKWPGR
jgi:hypothetical protein